MKRESAEFGSRSGQSYMQHGIHEASFLALTMQKNLDGLLSSSVLFPACSRLSTCSRHGGDGVSGAHAADVWPGDTFERLSAGVIVSVRVCGKRVKRVKRGCLRWSRYYIACVGNRV